ncbi:hypothetical protein VTI28DRAFT_6004 [Corynascus sepedonium]
MSDSETESTPNQDGPLLSISVPLIPVAPDEEENGFRVQNTSLNDWQREAVIERKGAIDVGCDLVGALHGYYGEPFDDGPFATLLVFKFRFDPQKHARRIIRCKATVEFTPMDDNAASTNKPAVVAIAPNNRLQMVPTTDPEQITTAINAELAVTAVPIVTPTIGGSFERTRTRDNPDATTVSGNISLAPGVNSGRRTCAGWTLLENATRRTGLPDSLRVAVLIKRQDQLAPFQAMVRMSCHADFKTGLGWFFGSFPIDDPVLLNPALPPQGVLKGYASENMATAIDLSSLMDVTFRTEYVAALRETGAA